MLSPKINRRKPPNDAVLGCVHGHLLPSIGRKLSCLVLCLASPGSLQVPFHNLKNHSNPLECLGASLQSSHFPSSGSRHRQGRKDGSPRLAVFRCHIPVCGHTLINRWRDLSALLFLFGPWDLNIGDTSGNCTVNWHQLQWEKTFSVSPASDCTAGCAN